jgi:predicted secreted protein
MFMVDEQDRDKAVAASHANLKMKQGTDILKREDPQAILQTRGYYTYPVYADEQPRPNQKSRPIIGWRVVQYLEMKTAELPRLPKTVSAAQTVLALNGLQFGLSEAAAKKLDSRRIEAAYRNLGERVASIARAMGRNPADASIETVDFEASGAYAQETSAKRAMLAQTTGVQGLGPQMEEPNFEPGETTLNMRIVGKVRFK